MLPIKQYVHWLKICGITSTRDEEKQYQEIQKYLDNYHEAKATTYLYDYALFDRVVKLECNQSYNDLDMMVNSFSNSLRRLSHKPQNISQPKPFEIPKRLASLAVPDGGGKKTSLLQGVREKENEIKEQKHKKSSINNRESEL